MKFVSDVYCDQLTEIILHGGARGLFILNILSFLIILKILIRLNLIHRQIINDSPKSQIAILIICENDFATLHKENFNKNY